MNGHEDIGITIPMASNQVEINLWWTENELWNHKSTFMTISYNKRFFY